MQNDPRKGCTVLDNPVSLTSNLSMLSKRIISYVFSTFQKVCMIQHGSRLHEKKTLAPLGTFQIDYRRATHHKTI